LSQDVRIHTSNYAVKLRSATIDFKAGVYRSDQPVTVVMADGATISADSALARDDGQEVTFSGHVRSTLPSEARAGAASAEMKETDP